LSRLKRIPLIFEIRDLWPESAIDTGVLKSKMIIRAAYRFERFIYRKSKGINTLTPAFFKKLHEEKNVPEDKLIMIPNAADFSLSEKVTKEFDGKAFRKELSWEDKTVFIYIGAHGVANHLIQIIDAAERLKDTNALFVLIGDGMEKKKLIAETEERKLGNVVFIDSVPKEEVFKYILASDVGMSVLKKADTFKTIYSNKTFDYMSCKKPILMVIDGISRDLVETAEAGLYAEPEDISDICEKINYLIENEEQRKTFGLNGYTHAKENFDRNVLAERYLEFIEKLKK
jgi:glycosyltransferase involved in cell wall biosynthesis